MARYNLSGQRVSTANAGLLAQLRTGGARDIRVYEIGVSLSQAVAGTVGLIRPTAVGSGFTSTATGAPLDTFTSAGVAVIDTAATTQPTIPATYMRRFALPATIGAGVIWSFPTGIAVPINAAISLWQISAAVTTYEVYFDYDE